MLNVIGEYETIQALLAGKSIARFGDGELRLAIGRDVGHQKASKKMEGELRHILFQPTKCLVGIPYIEETSPKKETWEHYSAPHYLALYNPRKQYHSAFITRPDSAPWIDTPEYWESVRQLWQNKDVIIVCGSRKGFRAEEMENARSIRFIQTLSEQAYADIDNIQNQIGNDKSKVILLAVGATATVLAWRLAERGFQALDLGHLPMFMRRRELFK